MALGTGGWFVIKRNLLPPSLVLFTELAILSVPFVRNYVVRSFGFRMMSWLALCTRQSEMQPLVLAHVKAATGFRVFQKALDELSGRLNSGQRLGRALDQLPPLPRRMALQVQIGEKTGNPENAIAQANDALEAELGNAQASFGRGMFISSYLLAGIVIGFTVIAMYLPIFKMGSAV